jgi:hypothetical protein
MSEVFNPMVGKVAEQTSAGLPAGRYQAEFVGAEYLPAVEPDPMTGKGGRQFATVQFKWRVSQGEHVGQYATRETPASKGIKSAYIQVCGFVIGKPLGANEDINLTPFVGRKYLLTVAQKVGKDGTPKNWTHVVNAMLIP